MITNIIAKIIGTANERRLRRMRPLVEKINALEPQMAALSDEQIADKTREFKEQVAAGRHLDDLLCPAFALVRETAKRKLGQRHYDVQLMGGIALYQGTIAEMKTGEGKTLTATLPLYLYALSGKGAHLVTVNDYLARRDAEWMAPVYRTLGLDVAYLQNNMTDAQRKKAYQADILYATNNELGFDYLRDNMKFRLEDYVQRALHYAIVDEVDSILIDEARTPLIISGTSGESGQLYVDANRVVSRMQAGADYEVDEKARSVQLTEKGMDKVEHAFGITNLYAVEHMILLHHINQALRAKALFKLDVDYVVHDGEVLIVDEFTGRILAGRRYSDGLHQAIEAKEGVTIERETQTLASITLQNYFRLYAKLAGMTGTAATESEEFHNIYNLDVISIPTNQKMIRKDMPDLIFFNKEAKYKAIVEDVRERHKKGQPVLIGTIAVETSELISSILRMNHIEHDVLNAKQHQREAEIVAHAGQVGHVTIATNMAGRGTDIKLSEEAKRTGGLYILGTERHESRRIDNQLRGRSGRQGDPGESRFYLSLEDRLLDVFGGEAFKRKMEFFGMNADEIIESNLVSKALENAQEKVEKTNFERRKHIMEYDNVLNQQRIVIYQYRRDTLEGENQIYGLIRDFINRVVETTIQRLCSNAVASPAEIEAVIEQIKQITGVTVKREEGWKNTTTMAFDLNVTLLDWYDRFRNQTAHHVTIKQAEKWVVLEVIDQAWKQHMLNNDHLQEGISLRSWGQKNPLVEYKREAFAMFEEMMDNICLDVVRHVFHLKIDRFNEHEIEKKREKELELINLISEVITSEPGEKPAQVEAESKIGRNDPCPCGSGKKYKKCHGIAT
jgi:preprotein translocase subunit SecA